MKKTSLLKLSAAWFSISILVILLSAEPSDGLTFGWAAWMAGWLLSAFLSGKAFERLDNSNAE